MILKDTLLTLSQLSEIQTNVQDITLISKRSGNISYYVNWGEWDISNRIKLSSLGTLLKILKPYFNNLPVNA